ncbi:hypothetical protein [Xylanimonas ulmi]|uniref:Uncharacterized protein n=1 Tax=Xylanimonas ulmi TaxID=228973 RepID=A0A4Q7M327_9MICO|nr:hypothetical protein [Xylanibacterium ulmi]RZS61022.1 hypothetical protein EV386_1303 [Xylanibacterium ulmi]
MDQPFDALDIFTPAVRDEILSIPGFADLLRDQWLESEGPEAPEPMELRNFGPGQLDEHGIQWLLDNSPDEVDGVVVPADVPHWRASECVVRVATGPAAARARALVVKIADELEASGQADTAAFRAYVESIQRLLDERKDQPETIVTGFAHQF